jgi:hypothetical protein
MYVEPGTIHMPHVSHLLLSDFWDLKRMRAVRVTRTSTMPYNLHAPKKKHLTKLDLPLQETLQANTFIKSLLLVGIAVLCCN